MAFFAPPNGTNCAGRHHHHQSQQTNLRCSVRISCLPTAINKIAYVDGVVATMFSIRKHKMKIHFISPIWCTSLQHWHDYHYYLMCSEYTHISPKLTSVVRCEWQNRESVFAFSKILMLITDDGDVGASHGNIPTFWLVNAAAASQRTIIYQKGDKEQHRSVSPVAPSTQTKLSHRILNSKQSLIIKRNIFQRWFTDFDAIR